MSIIKSPTMILGVAPPHPIDQSIRFNDDDSAYMHRTPSSGGNRDTWTWSCWIKRGNITSANATLFQAGDDSQTNNFTTILFNGNSGGVPSLKFNNIVGGSTNLSLETSQYFRDVAAWYHIVCVYDSGNDVSTERARIYVNGSRVTDLNSTTYPNQNQDSMTNHTVKQSIGRRNQDTSRYMDGYMAEIHLLDGYAYDPSYFGLFNDSGIWIPKEYSGSYGTNGFHIKGESASDLGNDSSGNNNDFTTSGLASHDQVLDTPTNNFAVLNPISSSGLASGELTGGNLEMRNISYIDATVPFPTSGKWYYELCVVSKTQSNWNYGNHYFRDIVDGFPDSNFTDYITTNFYHGSNFYSSSNWTDGDFWTNSNNPSAGDIYGFAWDSDTKKLWLAKNNTYFGSGNPAGNSGTPLGSGGTAGVEYVVTLYSAQSQVMTINFGQDDTFNNAKTSGSASASDGNGNGKFYYAPPSGFLALCTKNLGAD